jgi:hypothetical protein
MIFHTYHSRSERNIPDILENGFNEKFIGKKGGFGLIFGRGIYTTTNLKYVSMYHPSCNKILLCEIDTENYVEIELKDYTKNKKKFEEVDLLIIKDAEEYICKNLDIIKVTKVLTVDKIFTKMGGQEVLTDVIIRYKKSV